jgi:preprotein translocase subunit SecG
MMEYRKRWERGESMLSTFFTILQIAIGLFLIFIIMLQRGKGGGLVGALGGMGGASAFGPKADIQVLKLTIGLAVAWVIVACTGIYLNRAYTSGFGEEVVVAKKSSKDADKGGDEDKVVEPVENKEATPDLKQPAAKKAAKETPAKTDVDKEKEAPAKADSDAPKTSEGESPPAKGTPESKASTDTKTPAETDKAADKKE